nr:hypothetical protein CFP56_63091 [Quercus suber]
MRHCNTFSQSLAYIGQYLRACMHHHQNAHVSHTLPRLFFGGETGLTERAPLASPMLDIGERHALQSSSSPSIITHNQALQIEHSIHISPFPTRIAGRLLFFFMPSCRLVPNVAETFDLKIAQSRLLPAEKLTERLLSVSRRPRSNLQDFKPIIRPSKFNTLRFTMHS